MRVLITGSRTWRDHEPIHAALDAIHADHPGMVLVSGACAQGADAIAERWAMLRGVPVERHPAQWRRRGRGAGMIRNREMVEAGADVCLAFIAECQQTSCPSDSRGKPRPRPHGSHGATQCAAMAERAGIEVRRWTA